MLSANIPFGQVEDYMRANCSPDILDQINVACINSPKNSTLSGTAKVIDVIKKKLDDDGIFAQKLRTGVAYHSPMMESISAKYLSLSEFPNPAKWYSSTRPNTLLL